MTNRNKLAELLAACNLQEIFIKHLGWERAKDPARDIVLQFAEESHTFHVSIVAEKSKFPVCHVRYQGTMPQKNIRKKLEAQLLRDHHEHLLILQDAHGKQMWIYTRKHADKSDCFTEISAQQRQLVIEKLQGLSFSIAEENELNIINVIERTHIQFSQNAEEVTGNFYKEFRQNLDAFAEFIKGIEDLVKKEHYASLMLNRLMFIYFIQKKRYLNGETDYLRNRLQTVQQKSGKDKFYKTFYRDFLRRLFHRLSVPKGDSPSAEDDLIDNVPYLNGGLFDEHQIEKEYDNIKIADKAFKEIFDFFDKYQWYLDIRSDAPENEINPDVIGYIFEKYINDRAKMGAYYTKEDITGYIARNTIIPALLQKTKKEYPIAFNPKSGAIWKLLREDPDNYIYESVQWGCEKADSELPEKIRRGLDEKIDALLERRADWNKKADEEFTAFDETWRECIARRTRYFALKQKIENGDVTDIADLTTHNLDIEKLMVDAIAESEDADFISALYYVIAGRHKTEGKNITERRGLTVLDPACGSGAFLFAALKVLQPLYQGCIIRMRHFSNNDQEKRKEYHDILEEIDKHPSEKYWICRNIILRNLFGVDIMPDAVEVAKLRLFLKLAAEAKAEKPEDLEPLPDIDFNIRAGNSLIGFSGMEEFDEAAAGKKGSNISFDYSKLSDKILNEAHDIGMLYKRFVDEQTIIDIGKQSYRGVKIKLAKQLEELNKKLNRYLAQSYGIDHINGEMPEPRFSDWKRTHRPFHWFVEFYDIIMENGRFDVVIGNPPYVGYTPTFRAQEYTVMRYKTEDARDLYAFLVEKSLLLLADKGLFGMITPVSITTSNRCEKLRQLFAKQAVWVSSFSDRPSCLFADAHQMLTITIANNAIKKSVNSTRFTHWYKTERENLFANLEYGSSHLIDDVWGKFANGIENRIIDKILNQKSFLENYFVDSGALVSVCSGTGGYYLRAFNVAQESKEYRELYADKNKAASIAGIINSNIFYWFWRKFSNCRHLRQTDRERFNINLTDSLVENLNVPVRKAIDALTQTKEFRAGKLSYFQYRPARAKAAFDEIDKILAKHYGFTDEELDYIINYDYKYRMSSAE